MQDAKEELKSSVLKECIFTFGNEITNKISNILDKKLYDFEVTKSCTALSTEVLNTNEWYLKQFIAIKMIKGLSERTLKRYRGDISCFFRYIDKNVSDIQTNDIRYFMAIKAQEGASKTTVNNYLLSLRSFFGTLFEEEYIPKNPTTKIDRVKDEYKVKKPFTDYEIECLRKFFQGNLREKAILEVLLSTGCRVSELTSINRKDVKGNKIVVTGKGNKQRPVYLNAASEFALSEYLKSRTDNESPLFVGKKHNSDNKLKRLEPGRVEQIFRETGKVINIENCHPHRFRRTMATNALRYGMPIEQVSRMLGHEQLTTTQIYARSEDSDIENAHKKYVR